MVAEFEPELLIPEALGLFEVAAGTRVLLFESGRLCDIFRYRAEGDCGRVIEMGGRDIKPRLERKIRGVVKS